MKVLVACEESQRVCAAFRERGHEAYSCDIIEPSGGHPEWHILGDALKAVEGGVITTMDGVKHNVGKWDLMIAHPPCTYLSTAGACRLYPRKGQMDEERYQKGLEAKRFFLSLLNADIPRICVENPTPFRVFDMPEPTQVIQPYEFGHPVTKKTLLWLKNLPPLQPTDIVVPERPYCPAGTGRKIREKYGAAKRGDDRKERSKTFPGIAKAFSEQWGGIEIGHDQTDQ